MTTTLIAGCVELVPIKDIALDHKVVNGVDQYVLKTSERDWVSITSDGLAIYSYCADLDPDVVKHVDRNREKLGALGVGEHFGYWEVDDETGEVVNYIVGAEKVTA